VLNKFDWNDVFLSLGVNFNRKLLYLLLCKFNVLCFVVSGCYFCQFNFSAALLDVLLVKWIAHAAVLSV
jgi:hypothetical protein